MIIVNKEKIQFVGEIASGQSEPDEKTVSPC